MDTSMLGLNYGPFSFRKSALSSKGGDLEFLSWGTLDLYLLKDLHAELSAPNPCSCKVSLGLFFNFYTKGQLLAQKHLLVSGCYWVNFSVVFTVSQEVS